MRAAWLLARSGARTFSCRIGNPRKYRVTLLGSPGPPPPPCRPPKICAGARKSGRTPRSFGSRHLLRRFEISSHRSRTQSAYRASQSRYPALIPYTPTLPPNFRPTSRGRSCQASGRLRGGIFGRCSLVGRYAAAGALRGDPPGAYPHYAQSARTHHTRWGPRKCTNPAPPPVAVGVYDGLHLVQAPSRFCLLASVSLWPTICR